MFAAMLLMESLVRRENQEEENFPGSVHLPNAEHLGDAQIQLNMDRLSLTNIFLHRIANSNL